jgi:hypothetical protein
MVAPRCPEEVAASEERKAGTLGKKKLRVDKFG